MRFSLLGRHGFMVLHPVVLNTSGPLCWQHLEAHFHLQYAAIRELPYVNAQCIKTSGVKVWLQPKSGKQTVYFWIWCETENVWRDVFMRVWTTEQKREYLRKSVTMSVSTCYGVCDQDIKSTDLMHLECKSCDWHFSWGGAEEWGN